MRNSKENYYLDIAEAVAERGTCIRKKYGAVIVKDDSIVSTGYVGAPRGRVNCCDRGTCLREEMNIPRGERYELCRSVHAEQNAIIAASRKEMLGSSLFLVGIDLKTNSYVENASCCQMCKRMVINAGIEKVYIRINKNEYNVIAVSDWVENDDSLGSVGY